MAPDEETCRAMTTDLLQEVDQSRYHVSAKKAQICKREVMYLAYTLRGNQHLLPQAWKETVLSIATPKTWRQIQEFLGLVGFCRLWVPGFTEIAKPLYEATRG